jgi:15-cis-phytoene synthase
VEAGVIDRPAHAHAPAGPAGVAVDRPADPFAECEAITRDRARNFWYGIRLLPVPKRQALASVYAMARRIDDAGDDGLSPAHAGAALDRIEASLGRLDPTSPDPVVAALAVSAERFPLPMEAFDDLLAGVRMDVEGTDYVTAEDLVRYARRVAGSVGRLSLAVFGVRRGPAGEAMALADDLGVAMQLTNILRDVREDLGRGRLYLPAVDLARFACRREDLLAGGPEVAALIRFEADRAAGWFARGLQLLPLLDHRSAACTGAMAGIYRRLLRRISARPESVLAARLSLAVWEKGLVAGRALTTGRA